MGKKQAFLGGICLMFIGAISYYSCVKDQARLTAPVNPSYCAVTNTKFGAVIQPMMQTYCATLGCHDGAGGAPLNLNLYDDVKLFYDLGVLKNRVIDLKDMPPAGPLPDTLIKKLTCWMGKGAQNN